MPSPNGLVSWPAFLALVVLLAALAVAGCSTSSAGAASITSTTPTVLPIPIPTPIPTQTQTPTPQPADLTPEPTVVATQTGTSWKVFSAYESLEHPLQVADNQAWSDAKTASATRAAATKTKLDDQGDLIWLMAHPPIECYSTLYNDLVLNDNQTIRAMDDWFAGKYTTLDKVDLPAVNATWNRIVSEGNEANSACN